MDVIPLIDVLMVLILFFLTSMQFQEVRALNLKLPKIDSAGSNKITNQLIVSVSKEGEYYLNGNKDDLEEIGFEFNCHDACAATRMVDDKQHTV